MTGKNKVTSTPARCFAPPADELFLVSNLTATMLSAFLAMKWPQLLTSTECSTNTQTQTLILKILDTEDSVLYNCTLLFWCRFNSFQFSTCTSSLDMIQTSVYEVLKTHAVQSTKIVSAWTAIQLSFLRCSLVCLSLIYMFRMCSGLPGKSWNLKILNSRPGKSWKNTHKIS